MGLVTHELCYAVMITDSSKGKPVCNHQPMLPAGEGTKTNNRYGVATARGLLGRADQTHQGSSRVPNSSRVCRRLGTGNQSRGE